MKLAAIALTLATLSTGCTKHTTMGGGAVLAGGGAILLGMALTAEPACAPDDPFCGVVIEPAAKTAQVGAGAIGVLGLITGIALIAAGSKMGERAPTPTPLQPTPAPAPEPPSAAPTQSMDEPAAW